MYVNQQLESTNTRIAMMITMMMMAILVLLLLLVFSGFFVIIVSTFGCVVKVTIMLKILADHEKNELIFKCKETLILVEMALKLRTQGW